MSSPADLIDKTNLMLNSIPKLKQFYTENNLLSSSQTIQSHRDRPSLLRFRHIFKINPRLTPKNVIKPPSSGEDSDKEDLKDFTPSLNEVAKNITDYHTIMIVKDTNCFPKEAKPSLILINIDDWVNDKYIKIFLENVPTFQMLQQKLLLSKITMFTWNKKRCAWIRMDSLIQCQTIANFFYHPIKKAYPTKNSKGEHLDIFMCFDLLEITKSKWYGVVIRNLPPNSNDESIRQYCESFVRNGVKYCINPVVLRSVYCCIIVMNSLEDAENLCMKLNGYEPSKGRRIKVHFHPKICRIRKYYDISQFGMMFNHEGYEFDNVVEESGLAAEKAVSLVKMYENTKTGSKGIVKYNSSSGIDGQVGGAKSKDSLNEGSVVSANNNTNSNNKDNNVKPANNSNSNNNNNNNSNNVSIFKDILNKGANNNNSNNGGNQNQTDSTIGDTNNNFMAWYNKKMFHSNSSNNIQQDTQTNKPTTNTNTNINTTSNVPSKTTDEPNQTTSTPHEIGEIISTTPDTKTSPTPNTNETSNTVSHKTPNNTSTEMHIDYSQSEIDYYTYDMKDKAYYDSYKERMDILRDDHFKKLLQVSKEKIKRNFTKENNLLSKKEHSLPIVNVSSSNPSKPINLSSKSYYSEDKSRTYNKYQLSFNTSSSSSYSKDRDYHREREYQRSYYKDFREPRDYRDYKDMRSGGGGSYYRDFYHYKDDRHDKDYISRSSNSNNKPYYKTDRDYSHSNNNDRRQRSRSRSRKRERDRERTYTISNSNYISSSSNNNNNNKYCNINNAYHSRSRSHSQK